MRIGKAKQSKKRLISIGDKIWYNILIEKNPRCEVCSQPATQIHHFFYKSSSNFLRWDFANGISLCQHCHSLLHFRDPKLIESKITARRGMDWLLSLTAKAAIKPKPGYFTIQWVKQQLEKLKVA